jgi:hypothetical protein
VGERSEYEGQVLFADVVSLGYVKVEKTATHEASGWRATHGVVPGQIVAVLHGTITDGNAIQQVAKAASKRDCPDRNHSPILLSRSVK